MKSSPSFSRGSRLVAGRFFLVAFVGGALGFAFAGCHHPVPSSASANYPDHPNDNPAITAAPTTEESHAFTGSSGDKIGDDYVYYPTYEVYYRPAQRDYVYYNGTAWVYTARPAQEWKDIGSTPSVPMTFRDSPAGHHREIVRQYPRTWAPAPGQPTRTANDDLVEGKSRK